MSSPLKYRVFSLEEWRKLINASPAEKREYLSSGYFIGSDIRRFPFRSLKDIRHPTESPLTEAQLAKTCLKNVFFEIGSVLERANFEESDLEEAELFGVDCQVANFRGANLRKAKLKNSDFSYSDFSGADLRGADCTESKWVRTNLTGALIDDSTQISPGILEAEGLEENVVLRLINMARDLHLPNQEIVFRPLTKTVIQAPKPALRHPSSHHRKGSRFHGR